MIRAVLFDLDNTLTDFMHMKRISCDAALTAMLDAGLEIDKAKAENLLFEMYGEYGIEYQRIFQKFLERVNGKVDYRILASAITAYRRSQAGILEPYPRVRTTLIKLKEQGIKLAIVSDAPRMRAWLRITEMNLAEFFDFVVALDDTGKLKPHAAPFTAALEKLAMKPEEILFVGDNPERDIAGAKKFGMKTALAKYGLQNEMKEKAKVEAEKTNADYEINAVQDILKIVSGEADN